MKQLFQGPRADTVKIGRKIFPKCSAGLIHNLPLLTPEGLLGPPNLSWI